MTDTQPKPKRRFWQIHLSTAVVTMLVAGIILWLNLTPKLISRGPNGEALSFGWPLQAIRYDFSEKVGDYSEWMMDADKAMCIDGLVGLSCLVVAIVALEHLIRRRTPQT